MKSSILIIFCTFILLLFGAGAATGQIFEDGWFDGGTTLTGTVGAGGVYHPEFEGSGASEYDFFPYLNLNYGPLFFRSEKGLGIKLEFFSGDLEIAPAISYRLRRDQDSSDLLRGMGDVEDTLTLGGSVTYRLDSLSLSTNVAYGLSGDKGLLVDLTAGYHNSFNPNLHWNIVASTSVANGDYNQAFFGVTPEQSARSGYPVYLPEAGFKDVGLGASVDYFFSQNISLDLFANYKHLMGEAADSPIVQKGSPEQFSTGLILLYHFGSSY
jgi:outer membrane scaffolding protein for murein synthesis (MipA/OmpV family)